MSASVDLRSHQRQGHRTAAAVCGHLDQVLRCDSHHLRDRSIEDDAMEKWCARSNFRNPGKVGVTPEPLYSQPGEELLELHKAFAAVVS